MEEEKKLLQSYHLLYYLNYIIIIILITFLKFHGKINGGKSFFCQKKNCVPLSIINVQFIELNFMCSNFVLGLFTRSFLLPPIYSNSEK
jgi:hypothetical protein